MTFNGWLYSKARGQTEDPDYFRTELTYNYCFVFTRFGYLTWEIKVLSVNLCRDFLICQRYLKSIMASDQNNLQQVQCFTENCNKKFYINSSRLRYTIYHNNTIKKPMSFTVCLLIPFFLGSNHLILRNFQNYTKVVLMWGIFKLQDEALASLLIRPILVQANASGMIHFF